MAKNISLVQALSILLGGVALAFVFGFIIVMPAPCTIHFFGHALALDAGRPRMGWAALLLVLIVVAVVEGGIFRLQLALRMRQQGQLPVQHSIWARIGGFLQLRDVAVYSILLMVVCLLLYVAFSATFQLYSAGTYATSRGLFIYAGGIAA
jgi:hypothetical protein